MSRSFPIDRFEARQQAHQLTVHKSPDAFRTISEVAAELDVPQHVLRFWESKFSQIRPLKRGGGRRYYRPEDVDLLRGVRILLYNDGYTIKGVQKVFREQGAKFVSETGRGTVDTTLAELAREAVHRGDQDETVEELALDGTARSRLASILDELVLLKEEIDETLWDEEDETAAD